MLGLYEQQVQKVNKALLELLQKLYLSNLSLLVDVLEGFEEVSLASTGYHLRLENSLIELQINFLSQGTNIPDIDSVLMQKILNSLAVHQKYSCVVQHLGQG